MSRTGCSAIGADASGFASVAESWRRASGAGVAAGVGVGPIRGPMPEGESTIFRRSDYCIFTQYGSAT